MTQNTPLRSLLMSLALVGVVGGTGAALVLTPTAGASLPASSPVTAPAALPAEPVRRAVAAAPLAPLAPLPDLVVTQQAAGLECHLAAGDVPLCVHGEDRAPVAAQAAGSAAGTTPTSGQVGCYGTGDDGPRVRAVYARPQSGPDRYAASVAAIRGWAAGVSSQFDASAARTGGRRHVRFATTSGSGCSITVVAVTLPDTAFGSFRATIDALRARGLDRPSSKYLVWADTSRFCGLATMYADDRPGPDNLNNGATPAYARVDRGCWGKVEAHELVHMLGGVQPSARNSTAAYHCNDGPDVMCYDDGSARSTQRRVCGDAQLSQLDCRNDDYFSTAAPAGSYLHAHWNTARSGFLSASLAEASRPTAPPRSSASPSASPSAPPPDAPIPHVDQRLVPLPTLPPLPALVPALLGAVTR